MNHHGHQLPLTIIFSRSNEISSSARSAVYQASKDPNGWRLAIFHLGGRSFEEPLRVQFPPSTHIDIFAEEKFGTKGAYKTVAKALGDLEESFLLLGCDSDSQRFAVEFSSQIGGRILTNAYTFDGTSIVVAKGNRSRMEAQPVEYPSVAIFNPSPIAASRSYSSAGKELAYESADEEVIAIASPESAAPAELSDAPFVLCAGGGVSDLATWNELADLAGLLGATIGATRVLTDRGWAPNELQIGATGQGISPKVYLTFGVSGATQHLSNVVIPDKVISVNTDPACPMVAVSSLAVISDAASVAEELLRLIKEDGNAK